MSAILDLGNFHIFKGLEKNAIPFFLITTIFQMGINKKITFNKHFARKYIRAYTNYTIYIPLYQLFCNIDLKYIYIQV